MKKDGTQARQGEKGFIVGTNFSNYSLPLINYNTYDTVQISKDQQCSCRWGGMMVDYIIGRIENYILTPDGRYVGRLDHLFKDAKYVRNAQVEQNKIGHIIIHIEKERGYNQKIEDKIYQEAKKRLGEKMEINFDYDTKIEKDKNGKIQFIVQKLNIRINRGSNNLDIIDNL
jgi:phenylacetate-CoA ligase